MKQSVAESLQPNCSFATEGEDSVEPSRSFAGLLPCKRCGSNRVSVQHRGVSCSECFAHWPLMTIGEADRLIDAEVTNRWNATARPEHEGAGK